MVQFITSLLYKNSICTKSTIGYLINGENRFLLVCKINLLQIYSLSEYGIDLVWENDLNEEGIFLVCFKSACNSLK